MEKHFLTEYANIDIAVLSFIGAVLINTLQEGPYDFLPDRDYNSNGLLHRTFETLAAFLLGLVG